MTANSHYKGPLRDPDPGRNIASKTILPPGPPNTWYAQEMSIAYTAPWPSRSVSTAQTAYVQAKDGSYGNGVGAGRAPHPAPLSVLGAVLEAAPRPGLPETVLPGPIDGMRRAISMRRAIARLAMAGTLGIGMNTGCAVHPESADGSLF